MEFKRATFLKIYTGEDVMYDDKPLYKVIIDEARHQGIAGGTVCRGIGGYAAKVRGIGRVMNTFISGNSNLPIIIEFVDERQNIDRLLPFLEKNADHSLVVVEESTIMMTEYTRRREAERRAKLQEQQQQ